MADYISKLHPETNPTDVINPDIVTANIPDEGVTTEKIAPRSVTGYKIALNSVNHENMNDNSVPTRAIQDYAVTENKIADENVTRDKLSADVKTVIDGKVDSGSYDPGLAVGLADNLIDRKGTGTDQEFSFRTSAGSVSINPDSFAVIKGIGGKSVIKNQLVQNGEFENASTTSWILAGFTNNGTVDGYLKLTRASGGDQELYQRISVVEGHKYLFIYDVYKVGSGTCLIYPTDNHGNVSTYAVPTTKGTLTYVVLTATASQSWISARIYAYGSNYEIYIKKIKCIDLTALDSSTTFTTSSFLSLYPDAPAWAYNPGSILNNTVKAIRTTGLNQFDGVVNHYGINSNTGEDNPLATGVLSSADYIRVVPGSVMCYTATNIYGGYINVLCYDYEKNYLGSSSVIFVYHNVGGTEFTVPSNCSYIRFVTGGGTTYDDDICIKYAWSGYRNADIEPYEEHTLTLPTLTMRDGNNALIFPDGMKSTRISFDYYDSKHAVKVIDTVTDADFEQDGNTDYYIVSGKTFAATASNEVPDMLVTPAVEISTYDDLGSSPNQISISPAGLMRLYCPGHVLPSFTVNAPFAVPEETVFDEELSLVYQVNDFGTEEALTDTETTPFWANIKYQADYVRILETLNRDYMSMDSVDSLITALNSALTGTLSKSWDGTKWVFTYTP